MKFDKNDKSGVAEAFSSTQNTWTSTLGLKKNFAGGIKFGEAVSLEF